MLNLLFDKITHADPTQFLLARIRSGESVSATGLVGSSAALVAAAAARSLQEAGRQLLVVAPDATAYSQVWDDLSAWGRASVGGEDGENRWLVCFPEDETLPYDTREPSASLGALRQECLERLLRREPAVIISTGRALSRKIPSPADVRSGEMRIAVGSTFPFEGLAQRLVGMGFEREDVVARVGTFAVRGGIVDVYPFSAENPVRMEWDGDDVVSLRAFDIMTQRSVHPLSDLTIYPRGEHGTYAADAGLLEYLAPGSAVAVIEPDILASNLEAYEALIRERYETEGAASGLAEPGRIFLTRDEMHRRLDAFQQIEFCRLSRGRFTTIDFGTQGVPSYNGHISLLREDLQKPDRSTTFILCSNIGQAERLKELLEEEPPVPGGPLRIGDGELQEGFTWPDPPCVILTDHQIFGRIKRPRVHRRFKTAQALRHIRELKQGDIVVHVDHGIARYAGLERITSGEHTEECLKLLYLDGDKLFVPLEHFARVQKFSAEEGVTPKLNKLGSADWTRLKARTRKTIKDIAQDLITLYAERKSKKGFAFAQDVHLQYQMEASFEFEDTADQTKVTEEIKKDMESEVPMDRLVCGDVGYGKTEVAMRAAFKCVLDGKQAVVLVPTTILADQHFETFTARLREFAVRVDVLSRFRTPREQKQVLEETAIGKVDILIGTHRLLSKDVMFKDLGLLIIDEEQRFGVAHKEKLRRLKATVDTLTLTATPIPRTLHFSLMGGRDLSIISTPPQDRLPIKTEVTQFNEALIRHAITQELDRNGQVYYVHNRVQTIDRVADMLRQIVPRARFAVVHGQMPSTKLENVLHDFMKRKYDVLIATAIIENGIDIPNVNTVLVDQAHHFGLAQLYQLRGRVGRSNKQAYCYLLTVPYAQMESDAVRKLQAIEEFSDLGSGFLIAMRDLEIRGAGNLLGAQQSGFVNAVGFELYCQILDEAVREVRVEHQVLEPVEVPPRARPPEVHMEVFCDTYIPETYVNIPSERVRLYKELADLYDDEGLDRVGKELADRFGPLPAEAQLLLQTVAIKLAAARAGLDKVVIDRNKCTIRFSPAVLARSPADERNNPIRSVLSVSSNVRLVPRDKVLEAVIGFPWYDVQRQKSTSVPASAQDAEYLTMAQDWLRALAAAGAGAVGAAEPIDLTQEVAGR